MSEARTLADVLPYEFKRGEYHGTPADKLRDQVVLAEHDPFNQGKRWPGRHKHVVVWYELANGKAVGWNENPSRGWSFPVIVFPQKAK